MAGNCSLLNFECLDVHIRDLVVEAIVVADELAHNNVSLNLAGENIDIDSILVTLLLELVKERKCDMFNVLSDGSHPAFKERTTKRLPLFFV